MYTLYVITHTTPNMAKKINAPKGGGMGSTICLVYGTLGEVFFDVWEMGGGKLMYGKWVEVGI